MVVGIYLIVVGIIANKLNLHDLTYFNSILTLGYFVEMIAFGCSEGFGIYINQHMHEPEISKKYAKLGFYCTMVLSAIFLIGMSCVPNFVIKNILNLNFSVDLSFYYLMIIAIFFQAGFRYLNTLLARLKIFKWQLISSFSQCGFGLVTIVPNCFPTNRNVWGGVYGL